MASWWQSDDKVYKPEGFDICAAFWVLDENKMIVYIHSPGDQGWKYSQIRPKQYTINQSLIKKSLVFWLLQLVTYVWMIIFTLNYKS